MIVTVYTVLNSAAWSFLFVLALIFLSRSRRFLERFGTSALWVLAIICLLKLCIIVEFDATLEIHAARLLNPVNDMFRSLGESTDADLERRLLCIWLAGTGLSVLLKLLIALYRHCIVSRLPSASDPHVLKFQKGKGDFSFRVVVTPIAETPCVIGLVRETILLPDTRFTGKELQLILEHECAHIRRRDKWTDLLTQILCVAFWWNPAIYLFRSAVMNLCDFYCDAEVLKHSSPSRKRFYCRTVLACANSGPGVGRCFAGAELKSRFLLILNRRKPSRAGGKAVSILLAVVAFVVSYMMVFQPRGMSSPSPEEFTGKPVAHYEVGWYEKTAVISVDGVKYSVPKEKLKLIQKTEKEKKTCSEKYPQF